MLAYPLLARDGAVPDHQVHRPVRQSLRLRDETLRHQKLEKEQISKATYTVRNKIRGEDRESRGTDVRVVLAPRLALLGKAATGDSPGHDGCGGGFSSSSSPALARCSRLSFLRLLD